MPNLDLITKNKGVCFDNAFVASNHTRPSVVSFFTGLYPTNHGFGHFKSKLIKGKPRSNESSIKDSHNVSEISFLS